MGNRIHERAIVSSEAVLGSDNEIGPNCVIDRGVVIGNGNRLGPGVVVYAGTRLGDNNRIHANAVLGDAPQDLSYKGAETFLTVGSDNCIRENCTLHRGTAENSSTVVGNGVFLMAGTHVAHNCVVGDGAITANNATFAGYVEIGPKAFVSGLVVVHQFCRIGRLSIVSGLSSVAQDVPPFFMCAGRPAVMYGLNVVGLRRAGLRQEVRNDLKKAYKLLFRSRLSVTGALERIENECTSSESRELAAFIRASRRGILLHSAAEAETSAVEI